MDNYTVKVPFSAPWRLNNYCLSVQFMDGLQGLVNLSSFVQEEDPGVFIILRDSQFFKKAFIDHGAITWPGNLDLAPDAMYDAIKESGKYIL